MKTIIKFLLSIKTAFGFFLFFVAVCLYGSLSLPSNLTFFSGIDDMPLFRWLGEAKGYGTTWWIWLFIAALAMFALNTIVCTVEALLYRMGGRNLINKLAPQIMHIGVLFVMMGHLLTASTGVKIDVDLGKGETKQVAGGVSLMLEEVKVREDANGYAVDWEAKLRWIEGGVRSDAVSLKPAHPLRFGSYGVFSKSVIADPKGSSALIRVSRDPGAPWALVGGLLLCIGGAAFVYGRFSASSFSLQR